MRKDRSVGHVVLRKIGILTALASIGLAGAATSGALLTTPAAAQGFSDGFEFLKAVKERDGDAATDMLNQPGTTIVNSRDITSGESGLHIVTARRDVLWVRFLLQRGANPNARDNNGVTPLQLATSLGFIEAVEELIENGADVDVTDRSGETPLIAAVHKRDIAIIRQLLAQGANPDKPDNSGRSARDYVALLNGNSRIVSEFARADEERAQNAQPVEDYGPSF
ncbi:MAG: ankyrin repeat domain-containing protein [Erythrobacter sp.]